MTKSYAHAERCAKLYAHAERCAKLHTHAERCVKLYAHAERCVKLHAHAEKRDQGLCPAKTMKLIEQCIYCSDNRQKKGDKNELNCEY